LNTIDSYNKLLFLNILILSFFFLVLNRWTFTLVTIYFGVSLMKNWKCIVYSCFFYSLVHILCDWVVCYLKLIFSLDHISPYMDVPWNKIKLGAIL